MHRVLRTYGYDILRYTVDNFPSLRRAHILKSLNIDVVLDIGADEGAYALQIRSDGYKGIIISFEPLKEAFHILQSGAAKDALWRSEHTAIGDFNGEIEMNISGHRTSSSILPISPKHLNAMPGASYIAAERVRISRLDSLLRKFVKHGDRIYLKADVQGYERCVLEGAQETLRQTQAIEIELSLIPLYESSPGLCEMIGYLDDLGFRLVAIENVFSDPKTSYLLHANGIFVRSP